MIPEKYQIFDEPVHLSDKDRQRLSTYLSGWNKLIEQLMDGISLPDLQRLLVMELMDRQRRPILQKLLVRLTKLNREKLERRIERCLKKN